MGAKSDLLNLSNSASSEELTRMLRAFERYLDVSLRFLAASMWTSFRLRTRRQELNREWRSSSFFSTAFPSLLVALQAMRRWRPRRRSSSPPHRRHRVRFLTQRGWQSSPPSHMVISVSALVFPCFSVLFFSWCIGNGDP